MKRNLLLVDDEKNVLLALSRALSDGGYRIHCASSGAEGLAILAREEVGVIVADQRMPQMSGSQFLRRAKAVRPNAVRIVLSGYADIHSVTDAVNQGSIHKFLIKPWDNEQLRLDVEQAFEWFELQRVNQELTDTLRHHNKALMQAKQGLEQELRRHAKHADVRAQVSQILMAILESLPDGILAIDEDGLVVIANDRAHHLLGKIGGPMVGEHCADVLPPELVELIRSDIPPFSRRVASSGGGGINAQVKTLEIAGMTIGSVITLTPAVERTEAGARCS